MEIAALVSSSGPQVIVPPVSLADSLPLHHSGELMISLLHLSKRIFFPFSQCHFDPDLIISCSFHCQQAPFFSDPCYRPPASQGLLSFGTPQSRNTISSLYIVTPQDCMKKQEIAWNSLTHLFTRSSLHWHNWLKVVLFIGGWLVGQSSSSLPFCLPARNCLAVPITVFLQLRSMERMCLCVNLSHSGNLKKEVCYNCKPRKEKGMSLWCWRRRA